MIDQEKLSAQLEVIKSGLRDLLHKLEELDDTWSAIPPTTKEEIVLESKIRASLGGFFEKVSISQKGNFLVVKPRHFLHDKGDWIRINNFLKPFGARWISAGSSSHWKILLVGGSCGNEKEKWADKF